MFRILETIFHIIWRHAADGKKNQPSVHHQSKSLHHRLGAHDDEDDDDEDDNDNDDQPVVDAHLERGRKHHLGDLEIQSDASRRLAIIVLKMNKK